MDIRQSMIGIYRRARVVARPAGGALALAVMAACSGGGDSAPEKTGEAESAMLSGSTFEAADGNLAVDTGGNKDWLNAPNRVVGADRASGTNDNSFGQGTKEDSTNVTVVNGSIPPNKNDLTLFYVASDYNATTRDNFLYLAWERGTNTGSANLDFEINQRPTSGFDGTKTGPVTLNRTDGDILITYDFGGSGAPALGLLKWVTSGSTSQCFSASALPCWGNRVDLTQANEAEGAVNTSAITDSIQSPPIPLGAGRFGEAAINLTAAGVFPQGVCRAFGSAFVKSRSSTSFGAEVKDFIAPRPINISNCAIALTKAVAPTTILSPGDLLTYTLTYTNSQAGAVSNVTISDALPKNTSFVSVTTSPDLAPSGGCTFTAGSPVGTVSCTIPTLAAGASGTVTITVKLDPPGVFPAGSTTEIHNAGTITTTETGTQSSNEVVSQVVANAALAITKSVSATVAMPGDSLTYTLDYINNGNANAPSVVITDPLPPRTTFVSSSPSICTASGGVVTCQVGTVAPGGKGSVAINVKLDADFPNGTTFLDNTAVIKSSVTPDATSNKVTTKVYVNPVLALTKSAPQSASPGQQITYALGYANQGNIALSGVTLTDPLPGRTTLAGALPAGCTLIPDGQRGTVSCNIGSLAVNVSGSVMITVVLDPVFPSGQTTITNIATIQSTRTPPVSATASTVVGAKGVLAIVKTVDKTMAQPGATLAYTLTYSNSGNADLSGVVIDDELPDRTTLLGAAPTGCTLTADGPRGTIVCNVGALAAGALGNVTFTVQLDAVFPNGTTQVVNTAVITSNEVPDVPPSSVTTSVGAAPDLTFSKVAVVDPKQADFANHATVTCSELASIGADATSSSVATGAAITYTITLKNKGNANATNVSIKDPIPAGLVFDSVAPAACSLGAGNTVSCNVGTLAPGASFTATLKVKTQ